MDSEKYAKFDVSDLTYKVVNGQDIKAFVLTPKGIAPGAHPVVVKFHGGNFVRHPHFLKCPPLINTDHWSQPIPGLVAAVGTRPQHPAFRNHRDRYIPYTCLQLALGDG